MNSDFDGTTNKTSEYRQQNPGSGIGGRWEKMTRRVDAGAHNYES